MRIILESSSSHFSAVTASRQAKNDFHHGLLDAHRTEMQAVFDEDLQTNERIFEFDGPELQSVFWQPYTDLGFAFGHATVSNMKVTIDVQRVVYIDQEGNQVIGYRTNFINVAGAVSDLYDFDYSSGYAGDAASVQAGYVTLGTAGHVFREEVQLSNDISRPFHL